MYIFLIFNVLVFQLVEVQTVEVRSSITYQNDNMKGNSAVLNCSWTLGAGELVDQLVISSKDISYFTCNIRAMTSPYTCNQGIVAPDHKYTANISVPGIITMTISNLGCSDEGAYKCLVIRFFPSVASNDSTTNLNIKVLPSTPTFTTLVQTEVQENSNISATCSANMGYPNPLLIVWKYYINGKLKDDMSSYSPAISTTSPQQGDDNCTKWSQSTVTVKVDRKLQNLTLACFVTNSDFKPTAPDTCTNPTSDYCVTTATPLNVTYPVTGVNITRFPNSQLYEGNSVTLRCVSDGNPSPTHRWTKVGDENTTLTPVMDGAASILTLSNLNITLQSGTYNCTATNVIKNVLYSATSNVTINILPPTTPAPTTTTTTTTTTSTPKTSIGTAPLNAATGSDDNNTNIIIGVVVGVGSALIIAIIIIAVVCYRRRSKPKSIIEETSKKPYNNNSAYNASFTTTNSNYNMNLTSPQPDLVANEKKLNSSSLNSSFDKNDALTYADLTYDNKPRSRKPMAITDNSSIYSSEIQMPEV